MDSTRGVETMADHNSEDILREMRSDFLKYNLRYCVVQLYTAEDLPPLCTFISQGIPAFWKTTDHDGSITHHMRVYDINRNVNTQLSWENGVWKWDLSRVRLIRHDPLTSNGDDNNG